MFETNFCSIRTSRPSLVVGGMMECEFFLAYFWSLNANLHMNATTQHLFECHSVPEYNCSLWYIICTYRCWFTKGKYAVQKDIFSLGHFPLPLFPSHLQAKILFTLFAYDWIFFEKYIFTTFTIYWSWGIISLMILSILVWSCQSNFILGLFIQLLFNMKLKVQQKTSNTK